MLILKVEHHKTYILNATNEDLELVREALTVFKKKYKISQFAEQEWEITYLLSYKDFSFATAYLDEVIHICKEKEIKLDISDYRKYPSFSRPKLEIRKELSLRDDQKEAFSAIKENSIGIISMPTATGKSRVIVSTINYRKVKTLIIVPRTNLQTAMFNLMKEYFGPSKADTYLPMQLKEKVKMGFTKNYDEDAIYDEDHVLRKKSIKLDESVFVKKEQTNKKSMFDEVTTTNPKKIKFSMDMEAIGSSESKEESPEKQYLKDKNQKKWDKIKEKQKENFFKKKDFKNQLIKYKDIYIFCDASLDSMPQEFLDQFEMVIVDECHHAAAKTLRNGLLRMKNAAYRYYFSATPWRDHPAEEQLLAATIGTKIIFELSPEDAIKYHSVAKPDLLFLESPEPKVFMKDKKKWREILEFGIIGNETRNAKIVKDAVEDLDEGRNVFIAVDEISHVLLLKQRFENLGINIDIIHGEQPRKKNEELIEKVGKQSKGITIGTMSVGEGTDMPNIDSVIIASGGKSSIRFLQRIGRGARKGIDQTKTNFKVRDYFDWFHPTLLRHSLKRKSIFKEYYNSFNE